MSRNPSNKAPLEKKVAAASADATQELRCSQSHPPDAMMAEVTLIATVESYIAEDNEVVLK